MKNEKFTVIQYIRELIIKAQTELENFPKKDIEIKRNIKENGYELLKKAYLANTIEDISKKKELLCECVVEIKMIDFMLNLALDNKLITSKKYVSFGKKLDDVSKYLAGWQKSLNNE